MFKNILVLCLGNICRSPVAHIMLKEKIKTAGLNITVESAGLTAMVGDGMHPFSAKVLRLYDVPIHTHTAKQVTATLVQQADLILVMDDEQRRMLESKFRGASGKTFRLGHFGNFDIPDPYGQNESAFEKMYHLLDRATDEWIAQL